MSWELGDLDFFMDIPNSNAGGVSALAGDKMAAVLGEGQRRDRLPGRVDDVALLVLAGVEQDHRAARRVGHRPPGGGRREAGIVGYRQAKDSIEFNLKNYMKLIRYPITNAELNFTPPLIKNQIVFVHTHVSRIFVCDLICGFVLKTPIKIEFSIVLTTLFRL